MRRSLFNFLAHMGEKVLRTKIPWPLRCTTCGSPEVVELDLNDTALQFTCANGHRNDGSILTDARLSNRFIWKSRHELQRTHDYTQAVLYAWVTIESDLAYYFRKWKEIDHLTTVGSEIPDHVLVDGYKGLADFAGKVAAVSRLLADTTAQEYVDQNAELRDAMARWNLDSVDALIREVEQHVISPAQRIGAGQQIEVASREALHAVRLAEFVLLLFDRMDNARRERLEQTQGTR